VAAVEESCEVASITRTHASGVVAEPGNARALADAILTFYRDRTLMHQYGANARTTGLSFDRRVQVARYMDLFRRVSATPPVAAPVAARRTA
jgi:hypothetical protein